MKNKDKIISLELQVQTLTALLAEYVVKDAVSRIPVPEYKKKDNKQHVIINDNNYKEFVVCDGKNTPFPEYLKSEGYAEYQDWLNGISNKNIELYFRKGMLEADKELQRVCKIRKN